MQTTTTKANPKESNAVLKPLPDPDIKIQVEVCETTPNDSDIVSIYSFKTELILPVPPAGGQVFKLGARKWYAGSHQLIRWTSAMPFLFIQEESGDWQAADYWPLYRFIPSSKHWRVVFSLPLEQGNGPKMHFLDLETPAFVSTQSNEKGYRIVALNEESAKHWFGITKKRKALSSKLLEELLEDILSSFAVKATIIISD